MTLIGVVLPHTGALAAVEPLTAAVRAAEDLAYDTLWSRSVEGLVVAASHSSRLDLGVLAAEQPSPVQSALVAQASAMLGPRLGLVLVDPPHVLSAREAAPGSVVLSAGQQTPSAAVDGWAPRWADELAPSVASWEGRLVLRVGPGGCPRPTPELLIDLGHVDGLDALLAGWAQVAEASQAVRD